MNAAPSFKRIALIGFGLIGGSIARAAREQGLAGEIVATARSAKTRARVSELGIVDRVVETNAEAVDDADLVILCIPVGACGTVAQEIAAHLKPGAIVSDVGSVKGAVVRDMAPYLPAGVHFVPAHPVAGTEHSGPDSGFAELFINRWCILTPPEGTEPNAVEKLRAFWAALGARVEIMTPDHHDLVLAITSHLPHLIAYTIVGTADELGQVTSSEVMKFSAGGFRDFTRIAASDPVMWRDVFLANKEAVLEMLGTFNEDLSKLTRAIRRGDGAGAGEVFEQRLAVVAADGAGQFREILVEGAEHFQHGLLVGEEHIAPHRGIGGGDAGEVAEAAGRELDHFRRCHFRQLVRGADNGVGDQMRQMAGDREHEIMMIRRHDLDSGAEPSPERAQPFHRGGIGALGRGQDAPAVDEQFGETGIGTGMLGASHFRSATINRHCQNGPAGPFGARSSLICPINFSTRSRRNARCYAVGVECTSLHGRASERGYRVLSATAPARCGTLIFSVMQVLHEMPELLGAIAR